VVAQFRLPSHHPLPEGKMSCADCHNVHSSREGMLNTRLRPSDLCFDCHQNIEGPYVFEHEPVLEGCENCHNPHGAVADHLLVANEPTLCLQCHEPHFHAGYRGSENDEVEIGGAERENPFGPRGMNIAFTTKCTQCHSAVHGSDLPSQTVAGQGRGLTH
jgi:DmsE family decaheme c-type cytochrome